MEQIDTREERETIEASLRWRIRFERLVLSIATQMINVSTDEVHSAIDHALKSVGEFLGVDRAYVLLIKDQGDVIDNVYEWCADGIRSQKDRQQSISLNDDLPWFAERIERLQAFQVSDVTALPEQARLEKKLFLDPDIQSFIVVPVAYAGSLIGLLGLDSVRKKETWSEDVVDLLKMMAQILVHTLQRVGDTIRLKESTSALRTILKTSPVGIGLVEDRVIRWVNDYLCKMLGYGPDELIGKSSRILYPSEEEFLRVGAEKYSMIEEKGIGEVETRWRCKDDREIDVHLQSSLLDPNGRFSGVIFTALDVTERKKAERALRKSEALYRAVVEDQTELIVRFLPDLTITFVNDAYCKYFGKSKEKITGRNFLHHLLPHEQKNLLQYLFSFSVENPAGTIEHQVIAANGDIRWQQWRGRAIFNDQEEIIEFQGVGRDITDRKLAEQALKESEKTYRRFLEHSPEAVFIQAEERIVLANTEAAKLLGFSNPAQLLGKSIMEFVHPEYRKILEDWIRSVGEQEKEVPFLEQKYVQCDGTVVFVEAVAIPVVFENKPAIQLIARDITERKVAEQALQESEQKYRLVVEHANDGIVIAQDGFIKFSNPIAIQLTGYSAEELMSKPFIEFIHPDDRELVAKRYQERLSGKKVPDRYLFRVVTKSGDVLWFEIAAVLIDWEGRPATLNFLRNMTEQKNLEELLRQSQKMEAVGRLAGGIAHDFNNILAAIIGYTELLLLDAPKSSPMRSDLTQILQSAHRAKDLIGQILVFSRAKSGQERVPLDVRLVLKEVARMLRAVLPATIEIRDRIEASKPMILADATQIHQVIINLCTNAAHAMRESGGILELSLDNVAIDPDQAEAHPDLKPRCYVKLSVADTGQGIDPSIRDRIFDPYFTTKDVGEGSGLGLSVVHGIVKAHEGAVRFRTELGRGTTFDVFFPVIDQAAESACVSEETVPVGGEKILFIDDEEMLVEVSKKALEKLGYKVFAASSAREALDEFIRQPNRFDLVITDYTMPEMTGIQLAEKFLEVRSDIPIILCTGFSERIDEERAKAFGIREFAYKPLNMKDLARLIRRALGKD